MYTVTVLFKNREEETFIGIRSDRPDPIDARVIIFFTPLNEIHFYNLDSVESVLMVPIATTKGGQNSATADK